MSSSSGDLSVEECCPTAHRFFLLIHHR